MSRDYLYKFLPSGNQEDFLTIEAQIVSLDLYVEFIDFCRGRLYRVRKDLLFKFPKVENGRDHYLPRTSDDGYVFYEGYFPEVSESGWSSIGNPLGIIGRIPEV